LRERFGFQKEKTFAAKQSALQRDEATTAASMTQPD